MTGNFNVTEGSVNEREPTFGETYNVYATLSSVSINQMSSPSHVPLANLSRGRGRGDRPPVSPHFDLRDSNRPLVTPVAVTAGQSAFNLFPED